METAQRLWHTNRVTFVLLVTVIFLSFTFQIGHFTEHIIQVYVWQFVDTTRIYMSSLAMHLEHMFAAVIIPGASETRSILVGKEFLHLTGDLIFLSGIASLYFLTRATLARYALLLQTFHTYEHISLALTALWVNKAIGMSTLFGAPVSQTIDHGVRVYWHFFFNLIPMIFVGIVLHSLFSRYLSMRHTEGASIPHALK